LFISLSPLCGFRACAFLASKEKNKTRINKKEKEKRKKRKEKRRRRRRRKKKKKLHAETYVISGVTFATFSADLVP
jgi:hypothetical protein